MNQQKRARVLVANQKPLTDKTILVTRPKDQGEEFARLLQDRGARVIFVPTIQIAPPPTWEPCDGAIGAIDRYHGIAFTSANAVQYFFRRLDEIGASASRRILKEKEIYVVGLKTGEAVTAEGVTPKILSDVHDARSLANAMLKSPIRGKRFLFPKGDLASAELATTLKSQGATVDEVIVYATVAPREEDSKFIRESLAQESIDVVTFFSPSSVRHLLTTVEREMFSSCVIAAIGNSTAEAVEECGFRAAIVAPKPNAADLADAIGRYFSTIRVTP